MKDNKKDVKPTHAVGLWMGDGTAIVRPDMVGTADECEVLAKSISKMPLFWSPILIECISGADDIDWGRELTPEEKQILSMICAQGD